MRPGNANFCVSSIVRTPCNHGTPHTTPIRLVYDQSILFLLVVLCHGWFLYFYMQRPCPFLAVRFLIQFLLLTVIWMTVFFCLLLGKVCRQINKIQTEANSQTACVVYMERIPGEPQPGERQRLLVWIRMLEMNDNELDDLPANNITVTDQVDDENVAHSHNGVLELPIHRAVSIRPTNASVIQMHPQENVRVGDIVTVHFLGGDSNRPIHLPYLFSLRRKIGWYTICCIGFVTFVIVTFHYFLHGVPIAFVASQKTQSVIQEGWFCTLGKEQDQAALNKCCSITWSIAWAYNTLLVGMLGGQIALVLYVHYKISTFVNSTVVGSNSYQTISSDIDDEAFTTTENTNTME